MTNKTDLIKNYKDLCHQIKQLRVDHLKDIENLIAKYKADKKDLQTKRDQILKQIVDLPKKKTGPKAKSEPKAKTAKKPATKKSAA